MSKLVTLKNVADMLEFAFVYQVGDYLRIRLNVFSTILALLLVKYKMPGWLKWRFRNF